jgi:tetratricopeptide (TPR) repeat protein
LGPEQQSWLERLEQDHDNLCTALRWAQESGELELGLRLAWALWYFWHVHGHVREGRMWLEGLLADTTPEGNAPVPPLVRAQALNGAAWLAHVQADNERAALLAEQALAVSHDTGDRRVRGFALTTLAMVAMDREDYQYATKLQEEALALYRQEDYAWAIAACLNNLGLLEGVQGNFARAATFLEESVALERSRGDRRDTAISLVNLGAFEYAQGDLSHAQTLWMECLSLYQELGGTLRDEVAFEAIDGLAEIAAARGQARRAAYLFAASDAMRTSVGVPRPPHLQTAYAGAVAAAREALGAGEFTMAQAEGAALSLEQVIVEVQASA